MEVGFAVPALVAKDHLLLADIARLGNAKNTAIKSMGNSPADGTVHRRRLNCCGSTYTEGALHRTQSHTHTHTFLQWVQALVNGENKKYYGGTQYTKELDFSWPVFFG